VPKKRGVKIEQLEQHHDAQFSRIIPHLQPLPGANELLAHLARKKVPLAIATTGNRKQTTAILKRLQIPPGVPILTGDDVEKAKPSPDIFVAAAQRLNTKIADCIVVGDSVWDLLAAGRKSALGVDLLSGEYGQEDLERAGAFRVYSDPGDFARAPRAIRTPGDPLFTAERGRSCGGSAPQLIPGPPLQVETKCRRQAVALRNNADRAFADGRPIPYTCPERAGQYCATRPPNGRRDGER
jgi:HAD superfamily hydrolase (TIGR01549 family)